MTSVLDEAVTVKTILEETGTYPKIDITFNSVNRGTFIFNIKSERGEEIINSLRTHSLRGCLRKYQINHRELKHRVTSERKLLTN